MKRIFAGVLTAAMLLCSVIAPANAAGTLIHSDDFSQGFIPRFWITTGNLFEWDNEEQCIVGNDAAVVVESNYNKKYNMIWDQFYSSVDFKIMDFDDYKPEHEGRKHYVGLWYRDQFQEDKGGEELGAVYMYLIEIETGKATLKKEHSWSYYDETGIRQETSVDQVIAEGQIDEIIKVAQRAPYYNIGIRVTEGKIECYFNEKLVITAAADPNDTKYGDYTKNSVDASVGTEKSPVILWNTGNYMAFDNFEVWSADYDFVDPVVYGDADGDGSVKLGDVSLMLKHIAGWEDLTIDLTAADVDVNGSVNLTDASTALKVIAGWEGIVLGPQA